MDGGRGDPPWVGEYQFCCTPSCTAHDPASMCGEVTSNRASCSRPSTLSFTIVAVSIADYPPTSLLMTGHGVSVSRARL